MRKKARDITINIYVSYSLCHSDIIITTTITMIKFIAPSSWQATERVHPVYLMNANSAPGGRQPSNQAHQLEL